MKCHYSIPDKVKYVVYNVFSMYILIIMVFKHAFETYLGDDDLLLIFEEVS